MDEKLLFLINRVWTNTVLDRVMALASSFDAWIPLLVAVGLLIAWKGGFRGRVFLVSVAFCIAVVDGLVCRSLKATVDRPRPHQAMYDVRIVDLEKARPRMLALGKPLKIKMSKPASEDVEGRSFPSAHTVNNFAVATLAALFFSRGWLLFLPAALVGYSRVYVGSHWPSDVVVSMILSIGGTLLLYSCLVAAWKHFGPRLMPATARRHPDWNPRFA